MKRTTCTGKRQQLSETHAQPKTAGQSAITAVREAHVGKATQVGWLEVEAPGRSRGEAAKRQLQSSARSAPTAGTTLLQTCPPELGLWHPTTNRRPGVCGLAALGHGPHNVHSRRTLHSDSRDGRWRKAGGPRSERIQQRIRPVPGAAACRVTARAAAMGFGIFQSNRQRRRQTYKTLLREALHGIHTVVDRDAQIDSIGIVLSLSDNGVDRQSTLGGPCAADPSNGRGRVVPGAGLQRTSGPTWSSAWWTCSRTTTP